MIRSGFAYLKCIIPTNNLCPIYCLSRQQLHICVLVVQDLRYGRSMSKLLTDPPLSGLLHRLHVGLLQVTHDPNHQPNPCIHIHPIHHCYKGCKSKQVSVSIFQIGGCLSFEPNKIHMFIVLFRNYRNMIDLCQPHEFLTGLPTTLVRSDIVVEHHSIMYSASLIWGFLVNLISSLCSAVLMHAMTLLCSPLPCSVSK